MFNYIFKQNIERIENYDIDLCGVAYFLCEKINMDMSPRIEIFQSEKERKQFLRSLALRTDVKVRYFTFKVIISRFVLVNGNLHEVENSYIEFDTPYFGQDRYGIELNSDEGIITNNIKQYECFKDFGYSIRNKLNSIKGKYNSNLCRRQLVELKSDPFVFLVNEGFKLRGSVICFTDSIIEYFRRAENYKVIEDYRSSPLVNICGRFSKDGMSVFATLIQIQPDIFLVTGINCDKINFTNISDKPKTIYNISWKKKHK